MKLDIECMREILLEIENCNFNETIMLQKLFDSDLNKKFSEDDIEYTCLKLNEAGYLDITTTFVCGKNTPIIVSINSLTFEGHQFLENIRDDNVWNKTKSIAQKAGLFSVKNITAIAVQVTSDLIKSMLYS